MGVLDDAIREHLELKRRHGASDDEVAKEEAEALGPARRDFPAQPAAEGEAQAAEAQGAEAQAAEGQGAEPVPEPVVEPPPEPMPEPAPEPEPDLETRDSQPETESEPEPEEQPQQSDEDVLEDTPEFLQDAPEHDRLWFEQKPPRDFDFE